MGTAESVIPRIERLWSSRLRRGSIILGLTILAASIFSASFGAPTAASVLSLCAFAFLMFGVLNGVLTAIIK